MAEFRTVTGAAAPNTLLAHRWRHALVETAIGQPGLWDPATRIGVCGDWCLGGRVEAAYVSGIGLARSVIATGPAGAADSDPSTAARTPRPS